jgi:hypothetical protein
MSESQPPFEARLEELTAQVRELAETVEGLKVKIEALASRKSLSFLPESPEEFHPSAYAEVYQKAAIPVLLSSLATVCFLLVIALILRTVVDNGLIDRRIGSFVGLGYAGLLILFGFYRYSKAERHAPVFACCGAMLLFSIVFESHTRFESFSASLGYAILGVALVGMTFGGLRFGAVAPLSVGILGGCFSAIALEYPNPFFPCPAALLLLANCFSHAARRVLQIRWLEWCVLILTMFFWLLWTNKALVPFSYHEAPSPGLALTWLIPSLVVFQIGYITLVAASAVSKTGVFGFYEAVLPLINVIWAYLAAMSLIRAWHGSAVQAGTLFVLCALAQMSLAVWLAGRDTKGRQAAVSFLSAGFVLLALSLPSAVGSILVVLLIWSCASLSILLTGGIKDISEVRLMSHLFQGVGCIGAVLYGSLEVGVPLPKARAAVALMLCAICLIHYRCCRTKSPAPWAACFEEVESLQGVAIVSFAAALAYGFVLVRMLLFAVLAQFGMNQGVPFQCGQTIILNVGALALLLAGLVLSNAELLGMGFLVAVVGAVRVFGYDLLNTHGLPLVMSVFSFGCTAAVGSFVWNRRQRQISELSPRQEETL